LRTLRSTIGEMLDGIATISHDAPVALGAIRTLLMEALEQKAGELGHLQGGMRVCRLEAGTVLPASVVLIAGVDDALHPLGGGTPAWDLLQQTPQDEDPDHRADALDAFREVVASARLRVHVAWTGFTMAKHEQRAPSVAVSELSELAQCVLGEEHRNLLVRKEPAHPFSASLYSVPPSERIQSAAQGWGRAAALIRTRGESQLGFADEALVEAGDGAQIISLESLGECIKDPTLFFCKRTLGLEMRGGDEQLAEREPQAVNPPGDKGVDNKLRAISWRLESAQRRGDTRTVDEIREWLRHQPEMPYGEEGRELAGAVAERWWPLVEALRGVTWEPPRPVRLEVGQWTIIGRLDRLTSEARVVESLYQIKPHSAVSHWGAHLVMNVLALRGELLPRETHIVDTKGWSLGAVDDAEAELARLCAFYDEAKAKPQPLFRRAGCAWLEAIGVRTEAEADEGSRFKARSKAQTTWDGRQAFGGRPAVPGERAEAWNRLCWPERRFDEDDEEFFSAFMRSTERVLLPFLRARVGVEVA
jgi:exodeoxyribonuclease V gamma subunit